MASAATAPSFTTTTTHDPFTSPTHLLPQQTTTTTTKPQYTPRLVPTVMNYFKPNSDGSPPEPNYVGKPASYDRPVEPHSVVIQDIRGSEDKYSLDTTGFQIVRQESAEKEFLDDERIRKVYYPEVERILKDVTGATKVFIFDHTIRRKPIDSRTNNTATVTTTTTTDPHNTTPSKPISLRGPVQRVHIDQSYNAAPNRVTHHLPLEAPTLLSGRYQIINLWRPIKTILKDPLAVAAANSVSDADLVPIKLIYPDREGETFSVRYAAGHRWFFLDQQRPDEALLIKCFDSKTDGRARRVPHSSFVDREREGEEPRESIEVRALVFNSDDRE